MEDLNKKNGSVFLWLAVIFFVAGILTFIPYKNIDDECMLGYKALCAFTPVSALILFAVGAIFLVVRNKTK